MNVDAAATGALARCTTENAVSVRVAKLAMDQQRSDGNAAVDLVKAAAEVSKSTTRLAARRSDSVDTYA
jgi:hypothetical protein